MSGQVYSSLVSSCVFIRHHWCLFVTTVYLFQSNQALEIVFLAHRPVYSFPSRKRDARNALKSV